MTLIEISSCLSLTCEPWIIHCHTAATLETVLDPICSEAQVGNNLGSHRHSQPHLPCPGNCNTGVRIWRPLQLQAHFKKKKKSLVIRCVCVCICWCTTCCRGNADCLCFSDSQWERGGQSGVFLPTQGHLQHTHRTGRQTREWVTDQNSFTKNHRHKPGPVTPFSYSSAAKLYSLMEGASP